MYAFVLFINLYDKSKNIERLNYSDMLTWLLFFGHRAEATVIGTLWILK